VNVDALLREIIANPDDDVPRLVYADWLEEHGDGYDRERAEFIRVQCRLTALAPDAPEREALVAREAELLRRNVQRWLAAFPAWLRKLHAHKIKFERGLLAEVHVTGAQFIRQMGGVFRKAPVVSVRIDNLAGRLADVLACPHMARIHRLDLYALGRYPNAADLVAQAATLANVRSLRLFGPVIGASGLSALLASPYLTRLESVDLPRHELGDAGCRILAVAGQHRGLRELKLAGNAITSAGVEALAGAACLESLTVLDLRNNPIGEAGVLALLDSPHLASCKLIVSKAGWSAAVRQRLDERSAVTK
jgi:uncharacterized protein (TIGR02996 family)